MASVRDDQRIDVLGPVRIRSGTTTDTLTRSMEIGVLATLALNAGSAVSTAGLIDVLWPQDPPRTAGKTLQGYVKRVRGLVAAHGVELTHVGPAGYVLRLAPNQVDAVRFESMVADARTSADDGLRLRRLDEALTLWRGDPFAGCGLDGLTPHREWLQRLRSGTRVDHAATRIRLGIDADTIGAIRAQLVDEPTNERLWLHLAGALYLAGNPVAALEAITEARRGLDELVGVALGPELSELQRRMLEHDDVEGTYFRLTGIDRPPRAGAVTSTTARGPGAGPPVALSLPRWAGELVGQDALVDDVVARLDEGSAVVTICGPSGMGKTRCAVEAARRAATPCRGFVDLSAVGTGAALALHLAGCFGAPGRDDPIAAVVTRLGAAGGVVILDNLEQIPDAAPVVGELAARCPSVVWLLTSQTELGLGAEQTVRMRPLRHGGPGEDGPSPAAELVVAAARRRGVPLEADARVEEIAALVGGIPLALELAACQLQYLQPEVLLRSLADPMGTLVDPRRSEHRHRSMQTCFQLGLARLGPDATDLLALVSRRPAGCRFDDLMAWWDRPTTFPRAVTELVEVGFAATALDPVGATRITQVPLVRAFGRTVPRPPDGDAADGVLDRAVVERARASAGVARAVVVEPDLPDVRRLLQRGLDDPRAVDAALGLASGLMFYWWTSRITEGRRWLEALLDRAPSGPPSPTASFAVFVLALFDFYVGDAETARHRLDDVLRDEFVDRHARADLLALRAMLDAGEAAHAAATARAEQAVAIAREVGDRRALSYVLGNAGDVALSAGDAETARVRYVECIDGMRRGGLDWLSAAPHARLGDLDLSAGEFRRARMWYDRAIALWSARELGPGAPQTLAGLARLQVVQGDLDDARRHLDAALATAERCGSRGEYPWVVLGYAALLAASGRRGPAAVLFELGLRHGRAAGHHVRRLVEAELAPLYGWAVADPADVGADPVVLSTPLEDLPLVVAGVLDT